MEACVSFPKLISLSLQFKPTKHVFSILIMTNGVDSACIYWSCYCMPSILCHWKHHKELLSLSFLAFQLFRYHDKLVYFLLWMTPLILLIKGEVWCIQLSDRMRLHLSLLSSVLIIPLCRAKLWTSRPGRAQVPYPKSSVDQPSQLTTCFFSLHVLMGVAFRLNSFTALWSLSPISLKASSKMLGRHPVIQKACEVGSRLQWSGRGRNLSSIRAESICLF